MISMWRWLDALGHVLRRAHLIPGRRLAWVCDRYDLALGVSREDLRRAHEPDEPVGEVARVFDAGEKRRTVRPVGWRCEHMSMMAAGITALSLSAGCGCDMEPIYATSTTGGR